PEGGAVPAFRLQHGKLEKAHGRARAEGERGDHAAADDDQPGKRRPDRLGGAYIGHEDAFPTSASVARGMVNANELITWVRSESLMHIRRGIIFPLFRC